MDAVHDADKLWKNA